MRPGADEPQFFTLYAVDYKPVRFDVHFSVALPNAAQRMIAMAGGQRLLPSK